MWWNLLSLSVAGDIYELAAAYLTNFLLLGLRLFEAPQELLLLFSFRLASTFSINFCEGFRPLLDIIELIETSSLEHGNITLEDLW